MNYITFLKSNKTVFKLSAVQLIAYFATWFSNVAIYTLLVSMNVTPFFIAIVTALHFLPAVLQAPFTGTLIDRLPRRKLFISLLFIESITSFFLIFVTSQEYLWVLFILVYLKMSASSFYFTAEMSFLPQILTGKELKIANEIHSIIWSVSYALGMAISGIIVFYWGTTTAFIIDSCMFFIAILIMVTIPIIEKVNQQNENFILMIKDGLSYIKNNKNIIYIIILHSGVGFTTFDTLVTLLADIKYKEIISLSLAIGFLNGIRAIGLMIGPIFLSKFTNKKNFFYLLLFQGIAIIIWGLLENNFYLSLFGALITGFFSTTIWSYTYTMLQESVKSEYYGRVMAYNDMLFMMVGVVTSLLVGILAEQKIPLEYITYLIGIFFLITAIFYRYLLKNNKI